MSAWLIWSVERCALIWSVERCAWWRPAGAGYTTDRAQAGRYSREEAAEIVRAPQPRCGSNLRPGEPSELAILDIEPATPTPDEPGGGRA